VDLRTNIKLNGNMWKKWKMHSPHPVSNPPYGCRQIDGNEHMDDMSGNANNMSEHNAITKRKNAAGSWGCDAEFSNGSDKNGGPRSPWPSGRVLYLST
jgi:hypothetical protein